MREIFTRLAAASVDNASRTVGAVLSTGDVDRYGDRIDPGGWQLENFRRNPVLLFGHDTSKAENVIGKVKNIAVSSGALTGDLEFIAADVNPLAETVFRMVRGGFLSAVSVGFAPIEYSRTSDRSRPGGLDIKKAELMECSVVPIPALTQAVITARAAGIDTAPVERWVKHYLPEESEKMNSLARRAPSIVTSDPSPIFKNLGEFARAVAQSATDNVRHDFRLTRAPGAGHSGETDTSGGGFLVPSVLEGEVLASVYSESPIVPLLRRLKSTAPFETSFPATAETTRLSGARWGGAAAVWLDEANSPPNYTVARTRAINFVPRKLVALAPVTNELLQDAPMLGEYLNTAIASEFAFLLESALVSGTGAGMPLGILKAPGTITVAKDTGQAAATVTANNVENLWARLPAPCRKRAVWLCCEDVELQLSIAAATSPSSVGMYAPQNSGGNQFPLLKGRPLLVSEACSPLGTPGDIILFDPSLYGVLDPGIQAALSMDFFFANDQALFRFVWRTDAKPLIQTPITPANGSGITRSPFVALAQR